MQDSFWVYGQPVYEVNASKSVQPSNNLTRQFTDSSRGWRPLPVHLDEEAEPGPKHQRQGEEAERVPQAHHQLQEAERSLALQSKYFNLLQPSINRLNDLNLGRRPCLDQPSRVRRLQGSKGAQRENRRPLPALPRPRKNNNCSSLQPSIKRLFFRTTVTTRRTTSSP